MTTKTLPKILTTLLNIESGEERLVGLMLLHFFLLGVGYRFFMTPAYTLFLVEFDAQSLPYVYIGISIVVTITSMIYLRLAGRLAFSTLLVVNLSFVLITTLIIRVGLELPGVRWLIFILPIWNDMIWVLIHLEFWGLAGRLFDVRQGKRLFGLLTGGRLVGDIVTGFTTPMVVALIGASNLFFVSMAITGIALISLIHIIRSATGQINASLTRTSKKEKKRSSFGVFKGRYVILIFLQVIVVWVSFLFIETMFYDRTSTQYPDPDQLASFLGIFFAIISGVSLFSSLFVTGAVISRYGLKVSLLVLPVTSLIAIASIALSGTWLRAAIIMFWLATMTKLLNNAFLYAVDAPAAKILYQPLAARQRVRVQAVSDGIVYPVAVGIGGLILLLLTGPLALGVVELSYTLLLILIGWVIVVIMLNREYPVMLKKALVKRGLRDVEIDLVDETSITILQKALHSPHERIVIYALDMLEKAEHESLDDHLITLIEHPQSRIRAESLARLEQRGVEAALPAVKTRLEVESDPPVKGAALRALCALQEAEVVEAVAPYLDNPEVDIRLGAMVGLLRYGGVPGVLAAGERLTTLERSTDPEQCAFVARIIGEVGIQNFYRPLLPLLSHDDPKVRQMALKAAGQINHPRLLPAVVDNLSHLATRSAAMGALVSSGEAILPITTKALAGETGYDEETVVRLVRVCGQIKGESTKDKVIDLLKQHLNHPDDDVQYRVLAALDQCDYRAEPDDLAEIDRTLRGEVEHGLRVLFVKEDIGDDESLTHLHEALDYEFEQVHRRVFLLLSFVYDSQVILRAEEQLVGGSKGEQALAMETLDVTLSGEQKALVFPLVDHSKPLVERARQLDKLFTLRHISRHQRLNEIITDPEGVWTHGWTRACAIYAAAKLGVAESVEVIEEALSIREHPIRETAAWALYTLAPERYQAHAAELATDVNPQVAQLAATLA